MSFKIDFSDLKKLERSLRITHQDFDNFLRDFLIQMAQRVLAKTKPKTPVDTGDLKRAWKLGEVQGEGKNISVEILNGMEYATEIEYGHRIVRGGVEVGWYEGRFMLKTSIEEIDRQIPLRYKKELKNFCEARGLDVN